MGRRLTDAELAAYDHVPRPVAARARLYATRLVAPGYAGTTLGRHVLLRTDPGPGALSTLVAHELVHVHQYAEHGLVRFLAQYGRDYLRHLVRLRSHDAAYRAIRAEVEARARTEAWAQRAVGRTI